jgi:hypothetical protein
VTARSKKIRLAILLREKQRRLCKKSLYYLCKYVLDMQDVSIQPHWEFCAFLQTYSTQQDTLVLLPRGTFKSSIASVGFPIWLLLHNRDLRILISSHKLANSKGWLGVISKHLERNRNFRVLFGQWDANKKNRDTTWHSTAIDIAGRSKYRSEHSITVSSIETSEVSQHYDMAILDDLQTDENVNTKDMIDAVENYLELLTPIIDPREDLGGKRGPKLVIGTRWHFDDIYGRMKDKELKYRSAHAGSRKLEMYVRKCADRAELVGDRFKLHGQIFFPSRFSEEYLKEIQESGSMSLYDFSCQYLNDPLPEGMAVFPLSKINWWNSHGRNINGRVYPMPEMLNFFSMLDPSLGEHSDSDYTALVTIGVDREWNIYVWEVMRAHLVGDDPIIEEMFRVHEKFRPLRFGVESVAFQKSLVYGFNAKARERGKWFYVEALSTDTTRSKELRIRGFQPFVLSGKLFLRVAEDLSLKSDTEALYHGAVEGQDVLADELMRFPKGATLDCVDALAYAPQLIFPAGVPTEAPPARGSFKELRLRMEKIQGRRRSRLGSIR